MFAERRTSSSDPMWRQELRERTFGGNLRAEKSSEGGPWPAVAIEMDGSDVVCAGMFDLACSLSSESRQSFQEGSHGKFQDLWFLCSQYESLSANFIRGARAAF